MAIAAILGMGPATGNCQIQTYSYSGPVTGYAEVDLSPYGVGSGGFVTAFGTLTETLYYDPAAETLEQVGSVTVNKPSGFINIFSSPYFPREFGSATLTIGNGGGISFDNTFSGVVSGGGASSVDNLLVPVSGSGTYNGQAFAGNWSIDIPLTAQVSAASPTSLTFSESAWQGAQQGQQVIPGTDLKDAASDGTYYYSWQLSSIQAAALPASVPEPNSLELLCLGLSALAFLRRR